MYAASSDNSSKKANTKPCSTTTPSFCNRIQLLQVGKFLLVGSYSCTNSDCSPGNHCGGLATGTTEAVLKGNANMDRSFQQQIDRALQQVALVLDNAKHPVLGEEVLLNLSVANSELSVMYRCIISTKTSTISQSY